MTQATKDHEEQPKRCDDFRRPLRGACAQCGRGLHDWQIKHEMHRPNPKDTTADLHRNIGGNHFPCVFTPKGKGQCDDWIEMRPRHGPKRCNDHVKDAASGDGVGKQGDGGISVRQAFAHDPGADDPDQ